MRKELQPIVLAKPFHDESEPWDVNDPSVAAAAMVRI